MTSCLPGIPGFEVTQDSANVFPFTKWTETTDSLCKVMNFHCFLQVNPSIDVSIWYLLLCPGQVKWFLICLCCQVLHNQYLMWLLLMEYCFYLCLKDCSLTDIIMCCFTESRCSNNLLSSFQYQQSHCFVLWLLSNSAAKLLGSVTSITFHYIEVTFYFLKVQLLSFKRYPLCHLSFRIQLDLSVCVYAYVWMCL